MNDLSSILQSLSGLASQYPHSTRVLVNGKVAQAIYFDAGTSERTPAIRIETEIPPHLKPITDAAGQVTSQWRRPDE